METFPIVVLSLMSALIIVLIITIIKYTKDIIRGLLSMIEPEWFSPFTWVLSPIWLIAYGLNKMFNWGIIDRDISEGRYPTKQRFVFDFSLGKKYFISTSQVEHLKEEIEHFLDFMGSELVIEDFKIKDTELSTILCPDKMSFYDFNLLIQHLANELELRSYGVFNSPKLNYYAYQDSTTTHNIVGRTSDNNLFSIYTLEDLNKKVFLRMNDKLNVDKFDINSPSVLLKDTE